MVASGLWVMASSGSSLVLPVVELWRGFGIAVAFGLLVGLIVALVNAWKA